MIRAVHVTHEQCKDVHNNNTSVWTYKIMSPILNVPNEILHHIFSKIPRDDIDNSTLICHAIREATTNLRLEHLKRRRLYNSITLGRTGLVLGDSSIFHPFVIIHHLLVDDLLYYPTTLRIVDRGYGYTWGHSWNEHRKAVFRALATDERLNSISQDIEPLMNACQHIEGDRQDILVDLREGSMGTTLSIMVQLLPNLRSIHFHDYDVHSSGSSLVNMIARNILAAQGSITETATQALSKLTHLSVTHSNDFDQLPGGLAYYWPFFHLPSLRSFSGHHLDARLEDWSYARLSSNIEEIDLDYSSVDAQSFDTYLRDIGNLRKFRFHRVPINDAASRNSSLSHLVRCLIRYASHSLETLDITFEKTPSFASMLEDRLTVTLKAFQKLEYVRLAGAIFHKFEGALHPIYGTKNTKSSRIPRLVDFLPTSVRRFDLACEIDTHTAFTLLAGLPVLKADKFPNLHTIQFDCRPPTLLEFGDEIRKVFGNCGVQLIVGTQGTSD